MKTGSKDDYTWDDVIFENRNQNYGAYVVRQSYSRNTMIAFGSSISLVILLIFAPKIISSLTGHDVTVPIIKDPLVTVIKLINPPRIENPEVKPLVQVKEVTRVLPPQVVEEQVETKLPTNEEVLASNTSTDTEGAFVIDEPETGVLIEETSAVSTGPLVIAEVMPKYKGGVEAMMQFISRGVKYPRSAAAMEIEGTVFVSFVIDAQGKVADVKVVRGISPDCDKEAMRVIAKMTEWEAGIQNKVPVAVRMVLPIRFQISR